jgi:hypothetical protein
MRRMAAVCCVLVLPFLATVASADSNPYVSTQRSEVSTPDSAPNCQTKLDNNAYDCEVKSSFGSPFMSCFQFVSPGSVSDNFDLDVSGLGDLGCSCNPTGTFNKPKFNGSQKSFDCVGTIGFDFTGMASGKKLTGRVSSSIGDSFVFKCTKRSSAC